MAAKRQSSIRLSDEGYAIQRALSAKLGISGTAVIEQALRIFAQREGIERQYDVEPMPVPEWSSTQARGHRATKAK